MSIKILSIFLFTLFYFINLNNCQTLNPTESKELIDLYYQLYSQNSTNPCFYSQLFNCSSDGSGGLTVSGIFVWAQPSNKITTDFTVFKNLTVLTLVGPIKTTQNILNIVQTLVFLEELHINQDQEMNEGLVLPPLLKKIYFNTISVPLVSAIFSTGFLETLYLDNVVKDFKYPTSLPANNYLKEFSAEITFTSGFPNNVGSSLNALETFFLNIYNDNTTANYVDYTFPTFQPFKNLKKIYFSFYYDDDNYIQKWPFPSSILLSKNIETLSVDSVGFYNTETIDFSTLNSGFNLEFYYTCELFDLCSTPCLNFPKNTSLKISNCNFNLTKIDFTNVNFIDIDTKQAQPLPTDNIDFPNINLLRLSNSFSGTIPVEYCKLPYNVMELGNNFLTGEVPSCFSCYSGNSFIIYPNKFVNFNYSSPASSCPTFSIDDSYNKIFKTDGSTVVTISGKDFGWIYSSKKPINNDVLLSKKIDLETPSIEYLISNTLFTLSIPKGEGANLTYTGYFGYDDSLEHQFNYSYELPVITGYQFVQYYGSLELVLIGTGFSYVNNMTITLNGNSYIGLVYDESVGGVVITGNPSKSLSTGSSFTVSANVGGQKSNTITFYLYKSISLNTPTSTLKSIGGSTDLLGSFETSDKTHVTVTINSISCSVVSASPSNITINYPPLSAGLYELILNIGGNQLISQVQYVEYVPPTPTPSSTPSNSDSLEPSSSPKLFVSFIYTSLLSLFIISL